jgi:RNA polymerase sigma factor (sigma-70 family)
MPPPPTSTNSSQFPSTRWSTILKAGSTENPDSHDALSRLCERYWYPLYAYVRRRGYPFQKAQDLTQDFFAVLLEKNYLKDVQRERGKFRSFLLASLNHFLANDWDRSNAQKRGGGKVMFLSDLSSAENRYQLEPAHDLTPQHIFEKCWALALLDQTFRRLEEDMAKQGNQQHFGTLKPYLIPQSENSSYKDIAKVLNMTEGAVKVAVFRLRKRFRELLCEEIADTIDNPHELEDEIRYFINILSSHPDRNPELK